MKKRGRGSVPGIREKPREWSCAFDSGAVAVSSEPVSISCELPLSGCIEHWGQEYRFNDPVLVSATVTGDTSGMVVELAIEARTEVDCARCLEPTPLEISGRVHEEEGKGQCPRNKGKTQGMVVCL